MCCILSPKLPISRLLGGSYGSKMAQNSSCKTMMSSTSSLTVTLILIKTEYWDRASGEVGHACNS